MTTEEKTRDKQMDRYDAHMNKYGHRSIKQTGRGSKVRSPILDEILRSGQKLCSNYEERMGPPPRSKEEAYAQMDSATPIKHEESLHPEPEEKFTSQSLQPKVSAEIEKLRAQLLGTHRKDPSYMKIYMQLKRAEEKERQ